MNVFMLTFWTIAGIYNAGPVTTPVHCDDVHAYYDRLLDVYGGGSMDLVCQEQRDPDAKPTIPLPEPMDVLSYVE